MIKKAFSKAAADGSTGGVAPGYIEDAFDVRPMLAAFFSMLLIRYLALLEQLIQKRIFLFGIFVVLERLGEIVQGALSFPLLQIIFADAVVGPRVLIVGLEGSIEGFVGGLHVVSAQR